MPALPSGLYPEDYERIEAAVMETARGRWFLLEYARRQRVGETERLARAIERLERRLEAVDDIHPAPAPTPIESLMEPAATVISTPDSERRAQRISEKLQDFAWFLRERGLDERICAEIEDLARKVAELAEPPAPLVESCAETAAPEISSTVSCGPASARTGDDDLTLVRDDAPPLLALPRFAAGPIEPQPADMETPTRHVVTVGESGTAAEESGSRERSPAPAELRLVALSRLDNLSTAEKLALFT